MTPEQKQQAIRGFTFTRLEKEVGFPFPKEITLNVFNELVEAVGFADRINISPDSVKLLARRYEGVLDAAFGSREAWERRRG